MGLMRFFVHPDVQLTEWPEVWRGYQSGADGRIFPTRIEFAENIVACKRPVADSARFHVSWPVEGFGRLALSTASLRDREEPYDLLVELARGKLVQIRDQAAQWALSGTIIPLRFQEILKESQRQFRTAVLSDRCSPEAGQAAREAIRLACQAGSVMATAYAVQSLENRHRRYPHLPAIVGIEVEGAAPNDRWSHLKDAFNAASIPLRWQEIESAQGEYDWSRADAQLSRCEAERLLVRAGPLIDFGPDGFPAWLASWERDPFTLQSFACDFVETAMARYQGRVRLWEVGARINSGGALALAEEQRLGMLTRVLDVARQVDQETQILIRVDQPWGEYLARGQHRLSPWQMTDALVRSGVGLSGVNLEIAVGYTPIATAYRDAVEFSRLIDQWSTLGIPLYVTLACPSAIEPEWPSLIRPELDVDPLLFEQGPTEQTQARWMEMAVSVLIAKPSVVGVFWSHLSDAAPHRFPHAGLWRIDGHPKAGWRILARVD